MATQIDPENSEQDQPLKIPLGTILRDAARRLEDDEADTLPIHAMDPYLVSYLWWINVSPGKTLSDYANNQGIDLASYSRWLNKLVEMGLVEKERDTSDSRRRRLKITEKGRQVLKENVQAYEDVESTIAERMGKNHHDQLRRLIAAYLVTLPS